MMTLTRYHWLVMAVAFSLPCAITPAAVRPADSKERHPNVILILADDLGWAELGCYGNRFNETPNLDRLAGEGVRFTQAYAPAPVCSPTRVGLMTGQHPARVGITDYLRPNDEKHLDPKYVTLAELFRDAGYTTGIVGKWHLTGYASAGAREVSPDQQGFDEVIVSETQGIAAGSYFHPYHFNPGIKQRLPGKEHLVDRCNLEAVDFIERNQTKPFFLFLSHYAVHTRLAGKADKLARYEKKPGAGTGPLARQNNVHLAAQLGSIDDGVGMILKQLDELKLADNTVVIFASDNGGEDRVTSNAPLRAGKSTLYEGGIRVPLIARRPGHWAAGKTCSTPVVLTDLYPTVLELLGKETAAPLDGVSILPLVKDPASTLKRDAIAWHYPLSKPHFLGGVSGSAIRAGDWKLIEHFTTGKLELYNLKEDVGEKNDLAPAMPERVKDLHARLKAWRAEVGAQVVKHTAQPATAPGEQPPAALEGTMVTRWAKDVTPEKVHPEYPRPQMKRERWVNLNGQWEYAIRPKDARQPEKFDGKILVPFPVESTLSGVKKPVGPDHRLWYRRTFSTPKLDRDGRLLLHFGAVDWHAVVWVNGKQVGEHKGGYDPFTFDITDALKQEGEQEVVVSVYDPTDKGFQPRGKQVIEPRGIWYTSVTGIWQTVWLEPVPKSHIKGVKITPDIDREQVTFQIEADSGGKRIATEVQILDGERVVATKRDVSVKPEPITLKIEDAKLWSPDNPHLYRAKVSVLLVEGRTGPPDRTVFAITDTLDQVHTYFGMRKIAIAKDRDGYNRLFLNNKPLFQYGPLDQGWWPDGLYTAPTEEALLFDIEMTQKLGFNMIRKHVKVEPARWYYHCDRLGMLVWQDMPNGDRHIRRDQPDIVRSEESADCFAREFKALIDTHHNHPSIVVWVPFNEGWGQYETDKVLAWTKEYDPTRLVDGPSGWTDRGTGDMHDMHRYPGPAMPKPEEKRAVVLGEFGGLGLPLEGHLWWNKRNWGYRTYTTREELFTNYKRLIDQLRPLISDGLAAAVYTQTTDVEGEVNGLMTYDRAVVKFDVDTLAKMHAKLYLPPPKFIRKVLCPTSEEKPQTWRFTTSTPAKGWEAVEFDDSSWKEGPGGFGEKGTPGAVVRTEWTANDIWLRRTFEIKDATVTRLVLRIHHDEDAEVYLNGTRIASVTGYTTQYIEIGVEEGPARALKAGKNTLAVHCKEVRGGQYIDVGLVDVEEQPAR